MRTLDRARRKGVRVHGLRYANASEQAGVCVHLHLSLAQATVVVVLVWLVIRLVMGT